MQLVCALVVWFLASCGSGRRTIQSEGATLYAQVIAQWCGSTPFASNSRSSSFHRETGLVVEYNLTTSAHGKEQLSLSESPIDFVASVDNLELREVSALPHLGLKV